MKEACNVRWVNKYWLKYRGLCALSMLCVGMEALCDLLQPQIMSRLIDNGVARLDMPYVLRMGLLMLGLTAVGALFACARNVLSSRASQRFGADLRRDLFVKIQRLSISDAEQFDGGALVTRMTNDVSQMTNFVNGLMRISFKAPVVCIGSIVLAMALNVRTVPIVVAIVLVALASIVLSMRLSYPMFMRVQGTIDRLNTTVREYLMGIRLVKAFGRYRYEEERFEGANAALADTSRKANRILGVFSPVTELVTNLGIAAIVLLGARWVGDGNMQVGQIVAFISYMSQIFFSLNMINNLLNMFVRTKASYARVGEVMTLADSEPLADTVAADGPRGAARIDFEAVRFRYPLSTGEMALQDVAFSLSPGETLGIIGPTGSGKSTLATLLLRFYAPTQGHVRVDGVDVADIPVEVLRRRVAIVPQTPMLFTGTIRDNLRWGDAHAPDEALEAAARVAQADAFIREAPEGYDTLLGQHATNLSGGQKQRISIARALVRRPDVLILDDCTSALDALTEAAVLRALQERAGGMTCLLVSQRVSSVMRADKILVLEDGRQAGYGTHRELMADCPTYREIYASQMGREGGAA